MFVEKFVGARDGVLAEFPLGDGVNLGAGREGVSNFALGVARLDDVAGKQADEFALVIHDGKCAEAEFFLFNQSQHITDELVRGDLDRLLNQPVNVVFDTADLGKLLVLRHVVMDEAQAALAAIAMAMRDSVTVSMSDEMTGMLRRRFSASWVSSCVSRGRISE